MNFPFRDLNGNNCDTTLIRGKYSIVSVYDTLDVIPDHRINSNIQRIIGDSETPSEVQALCIGISKGSDTTGLSNVNRLKQFRFVTGDSSEVFQFARCGLILPYDSIFADLVLLDPEGRIRGYYDRNKFSEFERLSVELKILLQEEKDQ